jgi:hypothetical protein
MGIIMKIEFADFLQFLKSVNGQNFNTQYKQKSFKVETTSNEILYTPQSTGKTRHHDLVTLKGIVDRYNDTSSLHPGDYNEMTMNSSYTLAIIKAYLQQI